MKVILIILTAWSILGIFYLWHRIGEELRIEAMVDPVEYHTAWHYFAYGPAWWIICLLFRIVLFVLWLISR